MCKKNNLNDVSKLLSSDKFEEGTCCVVFSLNNEDTIEDCLKSLRLSKVEKVILADGGSKDRSVEIAKPFVDIIVRTPPGFSVQAKAALAHCRQKYLIGVELDHIYPQNFVPEVIQSLIESKCGAVQPLLRIKRSKNIIERKMARLYEFQTPNLGKVEAIGGPTITFTELFMNYLEGKPSEGASADTQFNEFLKQKNLTVAIVNPVCEQRESLDLKKWFDKFFWYGKGDCLFYTKNNWRWTLKRKMASVVHPGKTYLKHIQIVNNSEWCSDALFLISCAVIRYAGWVFAMLFCKNEQ
jgi:glycosyltransferase involved in cell wall biosynthesis